MNEKLHIHKSEVEKSNGDNTVPSGRKHFTTVTQLPECVNNFQTIQESTMDW